MPLMLVALPGQLNKPHQKPPWIPRPHSSILSPLPLSTTKLQGRKVPLHCPPFHPSSKRVISK